MRSTKASGQMGHARKPVRVGSRGDLHERGGGGVYRMGEGASRNLATVFSPAASGALRLPQEKLPIGSPSVVRPSLRPPLKWAGGKRWLVPYLEPLWQPYRDCRLVEPFVGGLAVTFGLLPQRALLNDVNPHTINFYQWLQKGLKAELRMENHPATFDAYRKRFNEIVREGEEGSKKAAELFYYLNRTCYNGLCRFNRAGEFNTPMGRYKTIQYVTDFRPYVEVMRHWRLRVGSFEKVPLQPQDFVYADPPYDSTFTGYSKEGFGWEDQVRLAKWLAKHPGPVVLSNQATPRIRNLYRDLGFRLAFVDAPRMINCTGDRTPAREVVATRNL